MEKIRKAKRNLKEHEAFQRIEKHLTEFNLFEFRRLYKDERYHTEILAWLFDPKREHFFGDHFLWFFLRELITEYPDLKEEIPEKILAELEKDVLDDLKCLHFNKVKVTSEKRIRYRGRDDIIDILIIITHEKNRLVIVIENKIEAEEEDNQLNKYFKSINFLYNDDEFQKIFVFLDLKDFEPSMDEWKKFNYSKIGKILNHLTSLREKEYKDNIQFFLNQYIAVFRRYNLRPNFMWQDPDVDESWKDLYKEIFNEKGIEYIIRYRKKILEELSYTVYDLFEKYSENDSEDELCELIFDSEDWFRHELDENEMGFVIRFTSEKLDKLVPKTWKKLWTDSKRVLLFELWINCDWRKDELVLVLEIGPGQKELVNNIKKIVKKNGDLFNVELPEVTDAGEVGKQWFLVNEYPINNRPFWKLSEYSGIDKMKEDIENRLVRFLKETLPRIEDHFKKHGSILS